MANYDVTTDMTLEEAIFAGSVGADDEITVLDGSVLTCDQTPSILMDRLWINNGELYIDGDNISTGNMINWVGKYQDYIYVAGLGKLTIRGKWFDIGTTDGTDSQVIDLSSTGSDYWDSDFCVDFIPMIQIETGRRINFDNSSGTTPEVDDWVYLSSDNTVMGRIIQVESTYLIVRYLTGVLVDDDEIQVTKLVDNEGPDLQVTWTSDVNHTSGDIKESGVYQEFGNSRSNGNSCIDYFHHGVGGFVFDNAFQSTNITLGSSSGTMGGFVPPSGCTIRVPNVHMCTSNATNYVSGQTYHDGSATEGNWYDINPPNGTIDISIFNAGFSFWGCNFAYEFTAEYMGGAVTIGARSAKLKTSYTHCVRVADPVSRGYQYGYAFPTMSAPKGTEMIDCMCIAGEEDKCYMGAQSSIDVLVAGCISSIAATSAWQSYCWNYAFYFCSDVVFNNNIAVHGQDNGDVWAQLYLEVVDNFHCEMFRWSVSQDGLPRSSYTGRDQISVTKCNNVLIKGLEWIDTGYGDYNVMTISDSHYVKVYALGMIDNKIDTGTFQRAFATIREMSTNIDISRIWLSGSYGIEGLLTGDNAPTNVNIQNCSALYATEQEIMGSNTFRINGVHGASGNPDATDGWELYNTSAGLNFQDFFRSDTVGDIVCAMIIPGSDLDESTIIYGTTGTTVFTGSGQLNMESGDVIEFTMSYFAKGHNSFPGTFTTAKNAAAWDADEWSNVTIDFQWMLDGGAWNGSWLDLRTASNLTEITGDIAGGIKFKLRFTATADVTGLSAVFIDTATTISIQKANFYPLSESFTVGVTRGYTF